jgi:murein DD-endopeptidase MepM/ murein hydrolase activator NlpD
LLFPGLKETSHCEVNLDEEALGWRIRYPDSFADGANPLLNPANCQVFLDDLHTRRSVDWSYGGYLEDRRHLWQGSYLEQTGNFLHLGVDFNVPQGTAIATPRNAAVLLVDHDLDRDGGWGQRIFLKLAAESPEDMVLIFAHLQAVSVVPGMRLARGSIIAEVGGPPDNGNWAPHLHIQTIPSGILSDVLLERLDQLDGYGPPDNIEELRSNFPNPLPFLGWR